MEDKHFVLALCGSEQFLASALFLQQGTHQTENIVDRAVHLLFREPRNRSLNLRQGHGLLCQHNSISGTHLPLGGHDLVVHLLLGAGERRGHGGDVAACGDAAVPPGGIVGPNSCGAEENGIEAKEAR